MRPSFLRLVVRTVLVFWAVGIAVIYLYVRSVSWTMDRARGDGVFLAHQLLDEEPALRRPDRLRDLQQHFSVDLAIVSLAEVERQVGRRPEPGAPIWHKISERREQYFVAFNDGQGALAAGPINPSIPTGFIPIGMIMAIIGLPVIAGLIALRVERGLTEVERANRALADGELSARVDASGGPSDELAQSFNAMAERVENLIRSRRELVQAVSHELGSPLSRLRFHVELLGDQLTGRGRADLSEAQREERVDAMTRELDALEELVAELLRYAQSDDMQLDVAAFDPRRGLTDIAELATLDGRDDQTIAMDFDLPEGIRVTADQRLFLRAVENILRNAVRHARTRVGLELSRGDGQVHVAVHDDGPGIPDALRNKVMAPFFRAEADRSRKTGGVGLGLAIVNRIVQRHGGEVDIGTSPLGGAMVTTSWPQRAETRKAR